MRTRKYDWLDMNSTKPMYGLQVRIDGEWMNVAENGKPCIFVTEEEREAKRAEIRRRGVCQLTEGRVA